jgi:hypothetical protein
LNEKQVLLVVVAGQKRGIQSMFFIFSHENRTMKLVEIILNRDSERDD